MHLLGSYNFSGVPLGVLTVLAGVLEAEAAPTQAPRAAPALGPPRVARPVRSLPLLQARGVGAC